MHADDFLFRKVFNNFINIEGFWKLKSHYFWNQIKAIFIVDIDLYEVNKGECMGDQR